jgi:hypothetical protein
MPFEYFYKIKMEEGRKEASPYIMLILERNLVQRIKGVINDDRTFDKEDWLVVGRDEGSLRNLKLICNSFQR